MRKFALLAAALMLPGCATITTFGNTFEGATDYTIVPLPKPAAAATSSPQPAAYPECSSFVPCIALNDSTRFQAYPAGPNAIQFFDKEADKIQISLKTATIGWFSEGAEQRLLNSLISPFSYSALKGEIALVANVTEGVRQPGSRDEDGKLEGRVVFYSDDVYKGQRLNEFNVPIYGPAPYGGGPLTIDLWVMELDRAESDQMGAVLSTLASMARTMPSVPTAGVDFLSRIGTSFLKSNADDVIGHFTVTLMPPSIGVPAADPILSVSDILIRRTEIRRTNMSFASCYYQPQTGRIFGGPDDCGNALDNYMVLALRKSSSATSIAPTVNLEQFQERLAKAPSAVAFNAAMTEFADKTISENAHQLAFSNLDRLKDASSSAAVRRDAGAQLIRQMQCSLLVSNEASVEVIDEWCGKGSKDRQMPMDDFDRVARRLSDVACIEPADISSEALLGDGTTTGLKSSLDAMLPKALALRASCPVS